MKDLLTIDRFSAGYGKLTAVNNVALSIPEQSIVAVLGANGAGKSTLLSAMMGLLAHTGTIRFHGRDISISCVEDRLASGISLVSETRDLFGSMSVEDNLRLGAYSRGRRSAATTIGDVYRLFPKLYQRRHQMASTLSGGERQMLALGRALMAQPKLLLLDEPSLGLAPLIVKEVLETVALLRERGTSVLLVEQNALAALNIADFGYVMELGQFTLSGLASDIRKDKSLFDRYLGDAR